MPNLTQHNAWWPSILALFVLGPAVVWIVYRDMALNDPLWLGGVDSFVAFLVCVWIVGKLAPSNGSKRGGLVWGFSVFAWVMLVSGIAIVGEGPSVLADLDVIASSAVDWVKGFFT